LRGGRPCRRHVAGSSTPMPSRPTEATGVSALESSSGAAFFIPSNNPRLHLLVHDVTLCAESAAVGPRTRGTGRFGDGGPVTCRCSGAHLGTQEPWVTTVSPGRICHHAFEGGDSRRRPPQQGVAALFRGYVTASSPASEASNCSAVSFCRTSCCARMRESCPR